MFRLLTAVLILFLLFSFVVCTLASYIGFGIRQIGERHPGDDASVRSGSTTGPNVRGRGPGSGK